MKQVLSSLESWGKTPAAPTRSAPRSLRMTASDGRHGVFRRRARGQSPRRRRVPGVSTDLAGAAANGSGGLGLCGRAVDTDGPRPELRQDLLAGSELTTADGRPTPPRRGRKGPFSTRMDVLASPEVGLAIIPRCVVNDYGRSESQHHLTPHEASPRVQWPSRPQFRRRANRMRPEGSARTVRRRRSNAPDATPCLR